jgi:dihydropteroate synthase
MYIKTKIVWVINLSFDSFSDGKIYAKEDLRQRITYLMQSWADIIDIGAESTAPWSEPVSLEKELQRLEIFFDIRKEFPHTCFSLDTMKSEVAKKGIQKWVQIINDVSWGRFDKKMFSLLAWNSNISYVLMYAKNSSWRADLIENTSFWEKEKIIIHFFEERIKKMQEQWVKKEQIILDPWMGAFISSSYEDSLHILKNLPKIKNHFSFPLFVGTSRKWFLSKLASDTWPQDRLGSSLASSFFVCLQWVDYIRVHDVREMRQFIDTRNAIEKF